MPSFGQDYKSAMWVVLIWIAFFSGVSTIPVSPEGSSSVSVLAPRITEFKLNLHHILEGSRIRKKRQAEYYDEPSEQKIRFGSSTPEDLPYLSDYNLTFWIPVNHLSYNQILIGTEQGFLMLFQISDVSDKSATTIALSEREAVAVKAKAFSHYDEQWFVVLQSSGNKPWIRLYEKVGRGLETRQTIILDGESDFDLVTVKGVHYLAVVTYQSLASHGISYQATVALYHWTETQFDVIASRASYGARSIACWVLDGSLYLAVGQEVNDEGNYAIGSPIYLYNAKEKNSLVLLEMLSTFGPTKVVHFYVAGSHYVIFIGQKDAVIYWWSSDQFLLWQTISGTAGAADVSVLSLPNNEVAIAIALKEEIWFMTLDDSGYYIISFTMRLTGSTLYSMQFMFSGKAYYALLLFATSFQNRPQPIWKLTLEPYYLPTAQSLDGLQQCLKDIRELMNERQNELDMVDMDLDRVWLKSKNQNVSTNVYVRGQVSSINVIEVSQVLILTDRTKYLETSTSFIHKALLTLKDIVDNVQQELKDAVYKTVWQEIEGAKHFSEGMFIPSLNIQSTNIDVSINGILISRLAQSALRKTGDQVFSNSGMVGHISTGNATVGAINGIIADDLLLLHGEQIVTGRLKFLYVRGSDISSGAINSIPVDHIVTTKSDQKIEDLKTILRLASDVIDVHGQTNGEYLSEIQGKIVMVDDSEVIAGLLNMAAEVHIRGDIAVTGLINGDIDVASLASKSVTKHDQQDLTGLKVFMPNVLIDGNLKVVGLINNWDTTRLLTLSTNQIIYSDIIFTGPLVVANNLILDLLNGIDLSEDAVLKYVPYQFIGGLKYFENSIETDFVDMTELVTLDGVDPSLLVQSIVKHKGVVKNDSTIFHNVLVKGKIEALGLNGHKVYDLPQKFWLKSRPQIINVTSVTNRLIVKHDLEVKLANNLNLDADLVHVFGDETIMSIKMFHNRTTVLKYINPTKGQINGIDIVSFKEKLEEYKDGRNIHGIKILDNLQIHGDLNINALNNLKDFSDLMLTQTLQTVWGDVQFISDLTSVAGNLMSNVVSFSTFNDLDIHHYLYNAVMVHPNSGIVKNKIFSDLKVNHLVVPSGSLLNNVPLEETLHRVVTLNTPQDVSAPKTFVSDLRFMKQISTAEMNGIEISDFVNSVVFVDEESQIILKQFLGVVQASHVFIERLINGIDIKEMANTAFYTSEENTVPFFNFGNDIDVGHLSTNSLDGVQWNNLIFVGADEVLGPVFFLSHVVLSDNLFITGQLNGCDLSQLGFNAIYSNKTKQIIKGEIKVLTIRVIGNVRVKDSLNTITDEDFQSFISLSKQERISSDLHISSEVSIRNVYLTQATNKANLAFILSDAVRHSVPQVISGSKDFKSEVRVNIVVGGDLFIYGTLNDVDLEQLHRNAVWKNGGYQLIQGDKILISFSTDTAVVEGYLNGLQIPRDVVMTDTSELITSHIIFMSDLFLDSELAVAGRIDGVDLDTFLHYRLTLTGKQNGTSSLYFSKDVVLGTLNVDGIVNDLVLDLVLNLKQPFTVEGYKAFLDLKILGSMVASTVNGHSIPLLERDILRYNAEEFVGGVQVFQPTLRTQNLLAYWINGISLQTLASIFTSVSSGLKKSLNYFEDLSSNLQQQLGHQLNVAGNRISMLAYFILVQEINLGPTTKILHSYNFDHTSSEFSHSMVMWTSQKHCTYMKRCCQLEFTYWLKVKKSGYVMIDGDPDNGRYYPIHKPAPYNKDFFIWTNATQLQPKWCGDRSYETLFLASEGERNPEIFKVIRNSPLLSEVKSFRHGRLYVVVAFYYDMKEGDYRNTAVFAYDEIRREWTEHQILLSYGVLSMDIISHNQYSESEILLALGTGMGSNQFSYSSVYKWNNAEREFEIFQHIPSRYVTSTLWIRMGSTLMLAMASVEHWPNKMENCFDLVSGGEINIFDYGKNLQWIQSIPVEGVISMVSFSLEGDTFLVAASAKLPSILIYRWKGYSGFVLDQSIFAPDVQHLNIYMINDEIYMTLSATSGSSKILKVVLQGNYTTSKSNDEIGFEQKDEMPKDQKIISGC